MSRRLNRGQALTEFLVAALALVPLFLLVPMVAKYQDIAHSTQVAARYAAFDALTNGDAGSGWKPEAQLADEVRQRFFSNSDAPIETNDVAGNFKASQNLFWRGPNGEALIPSIKEGVQVSYGTGRGPKHTDGFSGASDGNAFALRHPLSLQARGIYTANVSVSVADLPAGLKAYEPFDRLSLVMTRSTSVAMDPWTGESPSDVEARLDNEAVFPDRALRPLAPLLAPFMFVVELEGSVSTPKLGQLDFWRDVVPPDRLRKP